MIGVRRRLFWKVYLTLLASLLAVAFLMAAFWWSIGERPHERWGASHVQLGVAAAIHRLGDELGADISVYDAEGALAAARGAPIPLAADRERVGPLSQTMRVDLPDGRHILVDTGDATRRFPLQRETDHGHGIAERIARCEDAACQDAALSGDSERRVMGRGIGREAVGGAEGFASECQANSSWYGTESQSWLETLVNAAFRPVPSVLNAVTTTTARTPAITPYSKAVTARRSVFRAIQVCRYAIMRALLDAVQWSATPSRAAPIRAGCDARGRIRPWEHLQLRCDGFVR